MNKTYTTDMLLHVLSQENPCVIPRDNIEKDIPEFQKYNENYKQNQFFPKLFYKWCKDNSIDERIIHHEKGHWDYFLMKY